MLNGITTIIFDFGGVILNLNESLTYNALMQTLQCNEQQLKSYFTHNNMFHKYECGLVSTEEFVHYIQSCAKTTISTQEIADAWNAMLLDFPLQHIDLLLSLKQTYRTFLLSNTNELHEQAFTHNMKNQGITHSLHDLFEQVWYSHTLHLNKPHVTIFETVVQQANLNPKQTLFLDDKIENLEGAQKVGLQTQLIDGDNSIMTIFKDFIR
ncbi:MAG: HAD-IA family hydrolase [Bacteroidales bacterium]|jgi:putative hydrolase of the HAD superfamily|nr:HAD-IA family hydrolase [Bacteroidales bacterium]